MRGFGVGLAAAAILLVSGAARAEKCPNMLIVLDRSGSMSGFKWDTAQQAISTFVTGRQEVMRFGLHVFPAPGEYCGGGLLKVRCNFYTAKEITAALATDRPGGLTPTAEALTAALGFQDMQDASRRRFIILVSDGDPTCPDENNASANQVFVVEATQKLLAAGIKTFVIGFGQDVSPKRLDEIADAGGTARVRATCEDPDFPGTRIPCKYYDANDPASLSSAFDQIATIAAGELRGRSCDDSCYAIGGCPAGERCVQDSRVYGSGEYVLNLGKCVADPCAAVSCPSPSFCREGVCVRACTDPCPTGLVCIDGTCDADPCSLDPSRCTCSNGCLKYLVCFDGTCQDDPCRYVSCPTVAPYCHRGTCYAASSPPTGTNPDGLAPPDDNSGCTCGSGAAPLALFALAPAMLALRRRRRR